MSQVFEDWMKKHTRSYQNNEEKARRFQIFKEKYLYVQASNNEGAKKNRLYTVGLNAYSDLTNEEFQSNKCTRPDVSTFPAGFKVFNSSSLVHKSNPNSMGDCDSADLDWSKDNKKGRSPLSPIRNQGDCGSCWAVAAVEAVETANRVWWGSDINLPPLSVQQILDCVPGDRCEGGSELDAYAYIMKKGGLAREQDYAYTAMNGTCDSRAEHIVRCDVEGLVLVQPPSESALRAAICEHGPVTAGIASNSPDFREYKGGLFTFTDYDGGIFTGACGEEIDHTVLVVGYGTEEGIPYWKIQNSWGEGWGEQGFMKLPVDQFFTGVDCKITMDASFPLVVYY